MINIVTNPYNVECHRNKHGVIIVRSQFGHEEDLMFIQDPSYSAEAIQALKTKVKATGSEKHYESKSYWSSLKEHVDRYIKTLH